MVSKSVDGTAKPQAALQSFRKAGNLDYLTWATEENTWFEGYAWRIALCSHCGMHMGWRFEASRPQSAPAKFHGLLLLHMKGIP